MSERLTSQPDQPSLLEISDLWIGIPSGGKLVWPVRGVNLTVAGGARVGLIGESGSGKTLTALAAMGLIGIDGVQFRGSIRLDGRELLGRSERSWSSVRGREIAMVYQNPMSALNPIRTVGSQIVESIRVHEDVSLTVARRRTIELLAEVGIPDPAGRAAAYPFELSGGMRQRVVIAMALSSEPKVLIADEPTTALDVTTQARILNLFDRIVRDHHMAVLLITHDLELAASICTEIAVMYAGRIVERQYVDALHDHPLHPYTNALLNSVVRFGTSRDVPVATIGGQPPSPGTLGDGCAFEPRCPAALDVCAQDAPPQRTGARSFVECHLAESLPVELNDRRIP